MYNKRHWDRVFCTTPVCGNDGEFDLIDNWQNNKYCEYIKVLCPNCHAKYWMIKRNETYQLKWRKDGEDFSNRKNIREGN